MTLLRIGGAALTLVAHRAAGIRSERGATAVEYAVMAAVIAAVVILAVVYLGNSTSSTFSCTGVAFSTRDSAC